MYRFRRTVGIVLGILAFVGCVTGTPLYAGVITSGGFAVGITPIGNLYDPGPGIGFQRVSDAYDPIAPGTPREAWGVAAGAVSGFADPAFFGASNLVANGAASFGASTAFISMFLNPGAGNLLQIDQAYSFVAANVLQISNTITNVSGSSQSVLYSRNVDWDIDPTPFSEIITVPALIPGVTDASFFGFENPDPLVPFAFSSGPAGGTFGPGDLGGGLDLSLGTLAASASTSFNVFHAINMIGESETGLRTQVTALGATFVITGVSSDTPGTNSAALGVGPSAVPEPATWLLLATGCTGLLSYGWWRRQRMA